MIRILAIALTCSAFAFTDEPKEPKPATSGVELVQKEARNLSPLFETPLAQGFLAAAERLPRIEPRTIYGSPDRQYLTKSAWEKLPDEQRDKFEEITIDESRYYNTLYGTPLFYVRVVELLGQHGVKSFDGKKLLDYGYGTVGHLRLMADAGAQVVGVDVDTLQQAIYCESMDTGRVKNPDGRDGNVQLALGRFPGDKKIRTQIGDGYDLFTSKNTLKNGYVHPAEKVDPRMSIDLGVTDEQYVRGVHDILKPGGLALIYNLCPAPAAEGKPYIPWADGRCPFPREMWEANGFEVLVFDKDDSEFARKMAKALEWDAPPQFMDLEGDLFATWTLVRKKR